MQHARRSLISLAESKPVCPCEPAVKEKRGTKKKRQELARILRAFKKNE